MSFDLSENPYLLSLETYANYKTSIPQNISLFIYNFTSSSYHLINESRNAEDYYLTYFKDNSSATDFINSSGFVKCRFYAYNITSKFTLQIDRLQLTTYTKLQLSHSQSFDIRGTWKYKFWVKESGGDWASSDYIWFDVIEPEPNIEMISESPYTTEWEFIGSETAGTIDVWESSLSSNNWGLYGVDKSNILTYSKNNYLTESISGWDLSTNVFDSSKSIIGDSGRDIALSSDGSKMYILDFDVGNPKIYQYTLSTPWDLSTATYDSISKTTEAGSPTGIAFNPDGTKMYDVGYYTFHQYTLDTAWDISTATYDGVSKSTQDTGYTTGLSFGSDGSKMYESGADSDTLYQYTLSTPWDLSTATYNSINRASQSSEPSDIILSSDGLKMYESGMDVATYQYTLDTAWDISTATYDGIRKFNKDASAAGIAFGMNGTEFYEISGVSDKVNQHNLRCSISKFYQSSRHIYMQTNQSEEVSMRSPNNLNLNLQQGDKIELTFDTSSSEKISFNLLNSGTSQKSYVISEQGNAVFSDQTVTLDVDADYSIDQLEFSSLFEDTDNLIVKNIRIYRYNESTTTYNYKLDADGLKQVHLPFPVDYNYTVFEQGAQVQSGTITTTDTLQTLEYERIDQNIVYINYYDENNEHLEFQDYTTYVNYTWDGDTYENKRLSSYIMYADEETQITFRIEDSFDATVKTITKNVQTFIDIDLPVYELKIKNEKINPVSYTLKNNDTAIEKSGSLFEDEILELHIASATYFFEYTEEGESTAENITFTLNDHEYFVINRSQMCFISLANQRGEFLNFENYRVYVEGEQIYENVFYKDVNQNITVEIRDRFNVSLTNYSFIVERGDNYLPITLTIHSLKIYNQQEMYNFVNITRDPNYYEVHNYWSEWLVPGELVEFKLHSGYYKINITNREDSSYSQYAYTLNGDDVIIISSDNTITNVIQDITNVNTTLGNQITNVEINITNQNSEINNTIVNVEVNLDNVNSTLGNLLVSQGIQLTNIENNISTLFVYMNNNFTTLQNNINYSFTDLSNEIYLMNNSIYTAVVGLDSSLTIMNNSILGNLSIAIRQNDYLTAIYQNAMFSNLLNWSDVGNNVSYLENQIDTFEFINNFRNQSVEVMLKYKDKIDNLKVTAQNSLEKYLPKQNVSYRLKSVESGEYLNNWTSIENKTVDFGFFTDEVPEMPDFTAVDILLRIGIIAVFMVILYGIIAYTSYKNKQRVERLRKRRYAKIDADLERYNLKR
jgi:hypothetical protein